MSTEPGTILVGFDGSPSALSALRWAIDQATRDRSSITLVHAVPPGTPVWQDPSSHDPRESHRRALLATGADVLARARDATQPVDPTVTVYEVVRVGDPSEVLIELSAAAAMLVAGSRGLGPLRSQLLGSTSVALVRHAHCPVVVHRRGSLDSPRGGIAVGVDMGTDSTPVLDFAFRQASLRRESLKVVQTPHVRESVIPGGLSGEQSPASNGVSMADRLSVCRDRYPDVAVEMVLGPDRPERTLMGLAEDASLLVVGVHRRNRAAEFTLGSTAVWLVEHAGCSVAAVPLASAASTPLSPASGHAAAVEPRDESHGS